MSQFKYLTNVINLLDLAHRLSTDASWCQHRDLVEPTPSNLDALKSQLSMVQKRLDKISDSDMPSGSTLEDEITKLTKRIAELADKVPNCPVEIITSSASRSPNIVSISTTTFYRLPQIALNQLLSVSNGNTTLNTLISQNQQSYNQLLLTIDGVFANYQDSSMDLFFRIPDMWSSLPGLFTLSGLKLGEHTQEMEFQFQQYSNCPITTVDGAVLFPPTNKTILSDSLLEESSSLQLVSAGLAVAGPGPAPSNMQQTPFADLLDELTSFFIVSVPTGGLRYRQRGHGGDGPYYLANLDQSTRITSASKVAAQSVNETTRLYYDSQQEASSLQGKASGPIGLLSCYKYSQQIFDAQTTSKPLSSITSLIVDLQNNRIGDGTRTDIFVNVYLEDGIRLDIYWGETPNRGNKRILPIDGNVDVIQNTKVEPRPLTQEEQNKSVESIFISTSTNQFLPIDFTLYGANIVVANGNSEASSCIKFQHTKGPLSVSG